jgi:LDH2 family malate/lactate/ureidoglycolate dehydrogenase
MVDMKERKSISVKADVLRDCIVRVLRAGGCDEEVAKIAAEVFLEADMRGVGFQGIDHMHTLINGIRSGHIDPKGLPRVVKDSAAYALIDGNRGLGQPAALLAADIAIAKARKAGVCCVGITNSSDIFMIGFYVERIARAGLVGFAFTGAPPSVHPYGGVERILGTNPFAIAFPTAGENPVLIDMATSAVSNSYLRQAAYYDEAIPDQVAVDARGKPTNSAHVVRQGGAIAPLAGYKGFAMSLAVALLAGPLVGADTGKAMNGWRSENKGPQGNYGHFLLAIDPSCFGDPRDFRSSTSAFLDEIKSSKKAAGVGEIRIPGSRSFQTRERSLREGVRIYDAVWDKFALLAESLGVQVAEAAEAH